ncbi:MAG: hypothetical protein NTW87_24740 [Planctomycetota bacterium]|nr:hypothetical protein [Planctomycetota bacterium]
MAVRVSGASLVLGNGIRIELLRSGRDFLGLGEVRAGKTGLRSGRRPMFASIRTPDGVSLLHYRIVKQRITRGAALFEFAMQQQAGGLMEWMVHSVRNRLNTADWTSGPRDASGTKLRLELRAVARRVGGVEGIGFSYRYSYRSASLPIFKILDRGTWEPGGRAVGNEVWMRSCFSPPVTAFKSVRQPFSTEWYLPSIANPNIFQFLPLQTELQGFTFTAAEEGVLVTWPTEVAHVRTLIEKPRGANEIVHMHEHCGDLSHKFATPAVEVLWFPGKRDFVGRANLYEEVKETVHDALHKQLGMRRERVSTYGMIEEWGNPDFKRYAAKGLPKLLDAGVKVVGLANHFENNMNTYGVSNMCCTVDLKIAGSVGEKNVRAFCRKAKAGGAVVEMWGNTSLSTLSWILDQRNGREQRIRFLPRAGSIMEALSKAKAPFVRNPSNAIEADHYTPVFAVMNLRDPVVRETWLQRWKRACDRVGLGGIFLDSSFNLSSDKFHWVANADLDGAHGATADQVHLLGHYRPAVEPPAAILSQYRAHLELMTAMQQLGYRYCNEDLGVFGVHRHGPGVVARLDSLPIWTDCLANYDIPALRKAGADPDAVFFKGLAYRMMWMVYWDIQSDRLSFNCGSVRGDYDLPTPWHLALLKAFNHVEPYLRNRTILPDEAGVSYEDDGKQVLWAFQDLTMNWGKPRGVLDVVSMERTRAADIKAQKHHVYLVG